MKQEVVMLNKFDPQVVAEFENETWSRCAERYMEGFGPLVQESVNPLLDEVAIARGEQVLDIGTGPGLAASAAAERGASVIGVDFSNEMLIQAKKLHPRINFRQAPAEALPFQEEQFDVVIGNFVLHHSGDPEQVLRESFRVLRENGRVAYTVWAGMDKLEAFGLFFSAVEEHAGEADLPHGPLFGVSDFSVFRQMFREAGFRNPSVKDLAIAWRTSSIDSYLQAFRDWAQLGVFPPEIRQAIEHTVREKAKAYKTTGVYRIPNPAILISAEK